MQDMLQGDTICSGAATCTGHVAHVARVAHVAHVPDGRNAPGLSLIPWYKHRICLNSVLVPR